eukprot:Lithocolla_globosa_v1_NODE_185_length_5387_cov_5.282633.p5 type:complete len:145 gc:universal NODE_185_length_5387_cov_5.282633:1059-1493(+)
MSEKAPLNSAPLSLEIAFGLVVGLRHLFSDAATVLACLFGSMSTRQNLDHRSTMTRIITCRKCTCHTSFSAFTIRGFDKPIGTWCLCCCWTGDRASQAVTLLCLTPKYLAMMYECSRLMPAYVLAYAAAIIVSCSSVGTNTLLS